VRAPRFNSFLVAIGFLAVPAFAAPAPIGVDPAGNTPLHLAALANDADTVDTLLAAGADANATNRAGATPLHYGTGSERMVRALLKAGAQPNVTSGIGLTPLLTAVTRDRSADTTRLLLEAGADPKVSTAASEGSVSALTLAVLGGDPLTVDLLLRAGAPARVTTGLAPLAAAAFTGDAGMAEQFLDHGAPINHNSGFVGTALNFALYAGHPQVASLLIEFGANLTLPSAAGYATPPLLWSAYNETGHADFARQFLERGLDVNTINEAGETALSFALKRGSHTPLVQFLRAAGAREPPPRIRTSPTREVPPEGPQREAAIRSGAQQAVALLQRSSSKFLENGFVRDQAKCISCHQQTLPAVTFALARERGFDVDETALARQLVAQIAMVAPRIEHARQMLEPVADAPVSLGYGADALHALGYPADELTGALSHYLLGVQRANGSWPSFDRRPPMEDGPLVGTAWAARTLQLYPPRGRDRDVRDALQRTRAWLEQQTPQTHNERVFQLFGLLWSGQPRAARRPLMNALLTAQGEDGGWSQLPGLAPDAWATGSALVALQNSGLGTWEPAYRRGVEFLLRTQFDDGSWWVPSRSWPFQSHFDSAFPHGRDQWISAGGTAWATHALLLTLPRRSYGLLPNAAQLISSYTPPAPPAPDLAAVNANPRPGGVSFARDIQPLLERSCLDCHGTEKPRGGFSLSSRAAVLKGGKTGDPAIVPGRSDASHLLRYVADQVEDLEMPPARRRDEYPALTPAEVGLLRTWIEAGAEW